MTYSYDSDGRATGSVDAAGNTTTFIYGNLAGSNATTTGIQAGLEGLLAAVQYPTYREEYRYDVRNRQTQVIQNLDANTRYTTTTQYDAVGNPVKRTDPKAAITPISTSPEFLGGTTANSRARLYVQSRLRGGNPRWFP